MDKRFYNLTVDQAVGLLSSDINAGLTQQEVEKRLAQFGPNQLKEKKAVSAFSIFFAQFQNFIIWVLVGAALVSGLLKEWVDAAAIILIVVLNAILGFVQEYRAEKSLAALKKLSSPTSKAIRNNKNVVIPSSELVPGDIIELEAGDNVPCDSRIVWLTANFTTQEASLTGESVPVLKIDKRLENPEAPLAERSNMVYMGTSVSSGRAKALVVNTGMQTELGKIAGMIQGIAKEATPLQRKLEEFGKWIVYLCFALVALVFVLGVVRGGEILDMFMTSVSLAVAAIPEGLPAVVTISLALGVQKMVKRNALIRKLPSVETLGCATVICSDKTGTLTKNEMTVKAVYTSKTLFSVTGVGYEPRGEFLVNERAVDLKDQGDLNKILLCSVLCNGAKLVSSDSGYKIVGDPTEGALLTAAAKADIIKEEKEKDFSFIEEIPFDSLRKKMTIVRREKGKITAFVKGAPEVLLRDCKYIEDRQSIRMIEDVDIRDIHLVNSNLTNEAMRVLAFAYRTFDFEPKNFESGQIEKNLTFVGLMAMIDPPREEVKDAIMRCKQAGIKTVMITGDHKNTAVAIAKELGFFKEGSMALTSDELDKLSDEEFFRKVEEVPVYARVSPEHKLKIVRALKGHNEVVAMTGDGVNDAPAVKEADIGVAMGITGTDVTKEVSDMIVTDDNFASIVAAVEEGRGIYDNIKKFVHYLLSCNTGEILVMFVSTLIGLPAPLLPIHILWVNLVTDGLPALALGVDPVSPGIMKKPPRKSDEKVVTKQRAYLMLFQGGLIAFCSLFAFVFVLFVEKEGIERARTAAFIVLACSQLFHSFNCRNTSESLFKIGLFTNKKLLLATFVSFLLQMIVVYVPFAQGVFKTKALSGFDWTLVLIISSFPFWAMELFKRVPWIKKILSVI